MKKLISMTCLLLACQAVRAGDTNAAPAGPVVETKPAAAKADAAPAKAYEPAHKSVFLASSSDHNPFWPIGWVAMENVAADTESAPVVPHAEDFTVTTIMLNEPPIAVINGKEMAEGEIASLSVNGQAVMVQLMAVQDGRVILRWQNQNLVVPLHRQEELSRTDTDPAATAQR